MRDPETAPALIALSKDPRENVRRAAIKALGEIEAPGVPDLLRAALLDESSLVRQQAVLSLGKLQDAETARDLLPLLDDPDPRMRFVTLRALGQIRNPEAVPRLLPFLADARKELRFAAVEALGDIRAPSAVRPLIQVLSDPDRNLRRAAAESLGSIGDPQAVPPAPAGPGGRALERALRGGHRAGPHPQRQGDAGAAGPPGRRGRHGPARGGGRPGRDRGTPRAAGRLVQGLQDPALQSAALEALRRIGVAALPEMEQRVHVHHPRRAAAPRGPGGQAGGPAGRDACCWPPWPTTAPRSARRPRWPWATAGSWRPCGPSWT